MPPNGMKAMEWVRNSTPMTLGVFRSVRTLAMIFKAVLVWFLVFKQAGGSETHLQCHLYNQMASKPYNRSEPPPPWPWSHLEVILCWQHHKYFHWMVDQRCHKNTICTIKWYASNRMGWNLRHYSHGFIQKCQNNCSNVQNCTGKGSSV